MIMVHHDSMKKANFIFMHIKFVENPFSVVCQNDYNVAYGDRAK